MASISIYDIAGPIMVGPSSSHTAGAVKIGQMARALFNATPEKITFILHGSFAAVYKGHATDKALLAGAMKFQTKDERIKNAFEIAKQKGIKYEFKTADLGIGFHPNTVKIILQKGKKKMEIIGSSLGGGRISITKIDEFEVNIKGEAGKYFTLIIGHQNKSGVLAVITKFISDHHVNIANLQNSRLAKDGKALTIISLDDALTLDEVFELEKQDNIDFVRSLTKIA